MTYIGQVVWKNAWKYITNSNKASLTIDLFFIGIVFLDPKLSKEKLYN